MHRLASLTVVAVILASMTGCSSCMRWLGHGPTGAACGPQPLPAMAPCGPGMTPGFPAPYATGAPMMTDPNLVMPAPH